MATSLPPGFRFHPTDVELVRYYLKRKVTGKPLRFEAISEIDLYKFAPWDLPEMSCLQHKDLEWFFFCPRDRKYANGSRANRATDIGYWKTTGKDRSIIYNTQIVGMKKTLVFHIGRGSEGTRTDWVMYEYRMEDKELVNAGFSQDAFVLCKIFQKSGSGPKNGEQYGAPFKEEDWDDDQAILSIPALKQSATSGIVKVLSEFNGLLEQLVEDANGSSNFQENALSEITGSIILHKNSAEVSDEDIQHMYNDLENLSNQMELTPIDSMYFVDCVENENVLELNDLHFPWESDHSDWFVPNELFGHDPSFHDLNSSDIPTFPTDSGVTTASVVGNSLPRGPDNFDDQLALITEMDSSSGNIKWQYEADTLRISAATWGAGECESNYSIHELAGGGVCNSYSESPSKLQYLLGSILACPASAAEHPCLFKGESSKGGIACHGSSIDVETEITFGHVCSKEDTSDKIGDYCSMYCHWVAPPRKFTWKKLSSAGGVMFVFFLGLVSTLIWIFLLALGVKLGKLGWKLLFS